MSWEPPPGYLDRQPPFQPPQKRRWPRRHPVWTTVFSIVGVLVVLIIIGVALGSPKSSSPSAAISALPKSATVSPQPSPTPVLSAGEAKFVHSIEAAMRAQGQVLTSSEAQVAAVGQQVCTALGNGASQSSIISASKDAKSKLDMSGKKLVLLSEKDLCRKYLPKVLLRFSGSGIQNSAPFNVPSGMVNVHYSYFGCDGGYGNFIADLMDGKGDDQSIANDLGGGGHKTTVVYPTDTPGQYHLEVNGECSFRIVLISG
jgi:hypothetical protein